MPTETKKIAANYLLLSPRSTQEGHRASAPCGAAPMAFPGCNTYPITSC